MKQLFSRISVGDKGVCDDCAMLENVEPMTWGEWINSGLAPGVANTECGGYCRCDLYPDSMTQDEFDVEKMRLEKELNREVDRVFERGFIKVDMATGKRILLKDFKKIEGIYSVSYERIAYMESLIFKWKARTGKALPKEFYKKASIEKQIKWLRDNG